MSSLDHVEVLGALFSEYWRHLEETMSAEALKTLTTATTPAYGASPSSSTPSPSPGTTIVVTRLPPLNWSCLAAEFYTKTGMLLLPEHLMDCYLTVLETRCGGEVKELHRLFGAASSVHATRRTNASATVSHSTVAATAQGGNSLHAAARRSAGAGSGVSPSATANHSGLDLCLSPTRSDDARGLFEAGDPMSPLGRRDLSASFATLGGHADFHGKGTRGGEASAHPESGGNGNTRHCDRGADGRLLSPTSAQDDDFFHCDTPQWVRGLSSEQQQRLQRLRHETPLSPEILAQLLEQLSLVEGAALFMNPVQPQTMMMYNGVSAGPYKHIIHKPMCLATMKASVAESRRTYHLRTTVTEGADGAEDGELAERRGVKRARGSGGEAGAGGGPSGVITSNAGEASAVSELTLSENGSLSRVLTLADVERAVWQTAANCALFNAPESDYPFSARRFAVGCMKVLETYCHQQLLVE